MPRTPSGGSIRPLPAVQYACVICPLSAPLAARVRAARQPTLPPDTDIPPHLTILPPLPMRPEQLADVRAYVAQTARASAPFQISCGPAQSFEPVSPVVYLGVGDGRDGVLALHADLAGGPLGGDFRFPFVPHVTLAHTPDAEQRARVLREMAQFSARSDVAELYLVTGNFVDEWNIDSVFPLNRPVAAG